MALQNRRRILNQVDFQGSESLSKKDEEKAIMHTIQAQKLIVERTLDHLNQCEDAQ